VDFIGHVPTKDLIGEGGRYRFGKTKLYECLDALGIQRIGRDGDRMAYITDADLEVLDQYVDISNTQGKAEAKAFALSRQASSELSEGLAARDSGTPEYGISLAEQALPAFQAMQKIFDEMTYQSRSPQDTLAPQRQLKEAAEEGWLLSTAQVRGILGVKAWSGGDRYGFRFEKAGKVGASTGWRVSR
jgi:hypothetical protein